MTAVQTRSPYLDLRSACIALSVSRATIYGRQARLALPKPSSPSIPHPRALNPEQRGEVLHTLNSDRFCDQAPRQVYANLLDEGVYLCSVRTMYRVLEAHQLVRERRDQLRHPIYSPPQLLATEPNQVWSWDITKLLGPLKWSYFYLYVVLDIFSRYVVGWMLAERESALLASQLLEQTAANQNIQPDQLTIHADRGSSMRSTLVAQLFAVLGVTKTHSRPHVSNDNPFSESQFKTLKYRPEFPERFGCYQDALQHCRSFFDWYNGEHYHSGIGLHKPEDVHYRRTYKIDVARRVVLSNTFAAHPERFVNGAPKPPALPEAVWINPPRLISRSEHALPSPLITLGHTPF